MGDHTPSPPRNGTAATVNAALLWRNSGRPLSSGRCVPSPRRDYPLARNQSQPFPVMRRGFQCSTPVVAVEPKTQVDVKPPFEYKRQPSRRDRAPSPTREVSCPRRSIKPTQFWVNTGRPMTSASSAPSPQCGSVPAENQPQPQSQSAHAGVAMSSGGPARHVPTTHRNTPQTCQGQASAPESTSSNTHSGVLLSSSQDGDIQFFDTTQSVVINGVECAIYKITGDKDLHRKLVTPKLPTWPLIVVGIWRIGGVAYYRFHGESAPNQTRIGYLLPSKYPRVPVVPGLFKWTPKTPFFRPFVLTFGATNQPQQSPIATGR